MSRYRDVMDLDPVDAAYIAGIIDGEGTVTLTRKSSDAMRHLAVTISSTERDLLEYIASLIGAGLITSKRVYKERHADSFAYRIANRQAIALLRQIAPFLRTYKRERARHVLEYYESVTPRNGKYSADMLRAKEQFDAVFFTIHPDGHKRQSTR